MTFWPSRMNACIKSSCINNRNLQFGLRQHCLKSHGLFGVFCLFDDSLVSSCANNVKLTRGKMSFYFARHALPLLAKKPYLSLYQLFCTMNEN